MDSGRKVFKDSETPWLDASLLLAKAMGISREKLYMMLDEPIFTTQHTCYQSYVQRHSNGEPVAWILGHKEFWGLSFSIGPGVLCPRPDSEILVETALEQMKKRPAGRLHDCCTGPGTLALALATECPEWHISASDISAEAEVYFHRNNALLANNCVKFHRGDLLENMSGFFDIIVANPPYLTPMETSERKARGWQEPILALNGGGHDGLDLIRDLIPQAANRLVPEGILLIEADPLQMNSIRKILQDTGFKGIEIRSDLGKRDRLIFGRFREKT